MCLTMAKSPIVVAEDAVRHITVGGNVDLVIRQNTKPGTIVKIDGKDKERLKAGIAGSDLYLNSSDDERVVVYVWADDLETLTVKKNLSQFKSASLNSITSA
jgi:hypothetical protein